MSLGVVVSSADSLLDDPVVEANHRIANSLSIIASLIHFQVEGLPADGTVPATDVRNWLQELEAKVETIGDLHRLLISARRVKRSTSVLICTELWTQPRGPSR